MSAAFHSGFVAFVGRPNAGKSTLINALVGEKVAITSRTAQTTRRALRAVVSGDEYQIVAVDTPGLHKPKDPLGERLNEAALASLADIDGAVMVVDSSAPIGEGDRWVARHLERISAPKVLALNKCDRVEGRALKAQREAAEALLDWSEIFEVSAKCGKGVDELKRGLAALLPEGPPWYPSSMKSDEPLEATMAEIVREKVMRITRDEVPHSIGVRLQSADFDERRGLWSLAMTIYVERPSQKAIVIGAQGATIKRIGTEARRDIERLVGAKVFLDLKVDVKRHWRRDPSQIERFGYGLPS